MRRHNVERIDVIVIDAEGYDYQILSQIDLVSYRPDLIIYEQTNLLGPERRAAMEFLRAAGYRVRRTGIGWNNAAIREWR
jgi:hypothetical protein